MAIMVQDSVPFKLDAICTRITMMTVVALGKYKPFCKNDWLVMNENVMTTRSRMHNYLTRSCGWMEADEVASTTQQRPSLRTAALPQTTANTTAVIGR
jgi:hypothetical protein